MKTKTLILALSLALSLGVVGVTLANGSIERPREVLGGGAADAAGGDATMRGTLGQPVVGVVTGDGGEVTLGQGFWHGAKPHNIYLPLVIRN